MPSQCGALDDGSLDTFSSRQSEICSTANESGFEELFRLVERGVPLGLHRKTTDGNCNSIPLFFLISSARTAMGSNSALSVFDILEIGCCSQCRQ